METTCPFCKTTGPTVGSKKISATGWVFFAILLIVFFPVCWIPLVIPRFRNTICKCASCGKQWTDDSKNKPSAKSLQVSGAVALTIGIVIFMWARAHSPNMGFGEMMTKMDSFILKEPVYYGIMIIAALFAVAGVTNLVKGFGADGNKALNLAKSLTRDDSGLDRIRKAKELLDAGAIDAAEFEKIKKAELEK